jgi:hypothetical protein
MLARDIAVRSSEDAQRSARGHQEISMTMPKRTDMETPFDGTPQDLSAPAERSP